ncbi:hypothetical protein M434DRAFT_69401 [Hypoxylon sp. CO27-5]|nr:hypothetical protein M434DRAFT_69401 [Hypoxylon sp. CO27-5]
MAEEAVQATLKLVRIERDFDVTLKVPSTGFQALFAAMRADHMALYLICRDKDGYHEFVNCGAGYLPTRFLGTSKFALIWTYDPHTARTVGIFIQRRRDTFADLGNVLQVYASCAATPYVVCFAIAVHQIQRHDSETLASELAILRAVEDRTGFGPHGGAAERLLKLRQHRFDIDELADWMQGLSEVAGRIKNMTRHQRVARQMLEILVKSEEAGEETASVPEGPMRVRYETSLQTLSEAVPTLQRQMAVDGEYLAYLQYRAERLSGVLFAFLTHEDAAANTNLAAASKRDSSSMKTIAIMTMAFLPATFFAALFAVPSLRWEESKVIQSKFWVYWAFTLPTTALIFCIWLAVANRAWVRDKLIETRTAK